MKIWYNDVTGEVCFSFRELLHQMWNDFRHGCYGMYMLKWKKVGEGCI